MSARIMVVDDEDGILMSLRGVLEDEGHEVFTAETGEAGLALFDEVKPDLVFLDIWLPGMDGLSVLDTIRARDDAMPVIMISGHGNIETAVNAIKKGAFDFIEKPLSLEKVVISASKALEFKALRRENKVLRARINTDHVTKLTGSSSIVTSLTGQIDRVAPTDAWVLITGENGTGKEIVARMIHSGSKRANMPMVAVNCAAIPEELIESELFGHEKGAFTGAERASEGKFELADKGTLFLDEIGDMSMKTQAKILRILQEQSFERIGGRKTLNVDVRVIAATNKNLEDEIKAGTFREDLYYRLKVFPLHVAPLRERKEDIPELLEEFKGSLVREHGFRPIFFTSDAMDTLVRYPWPGNVRELKNFVERMLIMYAGSEVDEIELPPEIRNSEQVAERLAESGAGIEAFPLDLKLARAEFEAKFLSERLKECGGNISKLAEMVGLERSSLYRKLKTYNIQDVE